MESMRKAFEISFLQNHLCDQWHWTLHLSKCFICLWWRGWLSCAWTCSLVKLNRVRCVCRHNLSQMFSLSPIVEKFKQYSICVGNKRVTLLIQCRGNLVRSLCSPSGWTFSAPSTDTSVNLNAKSKSQLTIKTVQLLTYLQIPVNTNNSSNCGWMVWDEWPQFWCHLTSAERPQWCTSLLWREYWQHRSSPAIYGRATPKAFYGQLQVPGCKSLISTCDREREGETHRHDRAECKKAG